MDRTRKRDGHTDGRTDSAITICLPKFLWGHKNVVKVGPPRIKLSESVHAISILFSCCPSVYLSIPFSVYDILESLGLIFTNMSTTTKEHAKQLLQTALQTPYFKIVVRGQSLYVQNMISFISPELLVRL